VNAIYLCTFCISGKYGTETVANTKEFKQSILLFCQKTTARKSSVSKYFETLKNCFLLAHPDQKRNTTK
jgi:hypothetical protein